MALNIKNERVCRLAREAAQRSGTTQVSALETALERYLAELHATEDEAAAQLDDRLARVRATVDRLAAELTDEDRRAIRHFMDHEMHDDDGLPA